jgi:hypothetical protein
VLTRRRLAAAAAAVALGVGVSQAHAISTNCAVNASGGFINCLGVSNPAGELVDANHASGTPYRIQFVRFSDGARWGWWQYNDTAVHLFGLSLSGIITAQVDNLGTGNPSTYFIEMN